MSPVVSPPIVSVFERRDWIVEFCALRDIPFWLVVDERVAVGFPLDIPVTANCEDVVAVPPIPKSNVLLVGERKALFNCQ